MSFLRAFGIWRLCATSVAYQGIFGIQTVMWDYVT